MFDGGICMSPVSLFSRHLHYFTHTLNREGIGETHLTDASMELLNTLHEIPTLGRQIFIKLPLINQLCFHILRHLKTQYKCMIIFFTLMYI